MQLTFAVATAKPKVRSRYPDIPLPSRQYGSKDGVPTISFTTSEHQALTNRIRHTIVAKFQATRPPLAAFKSHIDMHWNLKGNVTLSSNWDGRHVVIFLDSDDDISAALVCPFWKVQHAFFRLFEWTQDYNPKKEDTRVTKWIKMPGLPMEFFTRSSIKAIVSSFAHFLDIDDRTYHMNSLQCARACVELDVADNIPAKVWISAGEQSFFQDIVVEGGIAYCTKYKIHGHEISCCRKAIKKPDQQQPPKEIPAKKVAADSEGWQVPNKRKAARGKFITTADHIHQQDNTEQSSQKNAMALVVAQTTDTSPRDKDLIHPMSPEIETDLPALTPNINNAPDTESHNEAQPEKEMDLPQSMDSRAMLADMKLNPIIPIQAPVKASGHKIQLQPSTKFPKETHPKALKKAVEHQHTAPPRGPSSSSTPLQGIATKDLNTGRVTEDTHISSGPHV